ncbi:MAG: hypothetical protein HY222_00695 [Thaumarchaeota archaeon]|nr:hypothetical protein [Nitrososphaerota archaeon]MBI3640903.1 hypothetical protein [Nitrososphaerota archaeon]
MGKDDVFKILGLGIAAVGVIAQLNAPRCPVCGTKLVIISNYCINCKVSQH